MFQITITVWGPILIQLGKNPLYNPSTPSVPIVYKKMNYF